MKIFALESSAKPASALWWEDGRIRASFYQDCGLTHSRTLTALCEELLSSAGLSLSEADLLAVSAGPGSFTGVRIGIAAVKGMAFGAGIPCIAVSSLEALAFGAAAFFEGARLCACADARAGRMYAAEFRAKGGAARRLSEDRTVETAALAEELPARTVLLGDGAEAVRAAGEALGKAFRLAPAQVRLPGALGTALAAAAAPERAVPGELLIPVYLQKPQAERNRSAETKK